MASPLPSAPPLLSLYTWRGWTGNRDSSVGASQLYGPAKQVFKAYILLCCFCVALRVFPRSPPCPPPPRRYLCMTYARPGRRRGCLSNAAAVPSVRVSVALPPRFCLTAAHLQNLTPPNVDEREQFVIRRICGVNLSQRTSWWEATQIRHAPDVHCSIQQDSGQSGLLFA